MVRTVCLPPAALVNGTTLLQHTLCTLHQALLRVEEEEEDKGREKRRDRERERRERENGGQMRGIKEGRGRERKDKV